MAEIWDVWYPQAGATGLSFARGRIAGTTSIFIHAAPPALTVTVRNEDGQMLAEGQNLPRTADTPITLLTRHADRIERADIWPTANDIGQLVLLAGGEVGRLQQWWHAADHSEWRWQVEFYNHR